MKEENQETNQKLQDLNQKIEELKNNLEISEEDKRNFENDINLLKKEKNEILDLQKDNQKNIEEYEKQIQFRMNENDKLVEEYESFIENESKRDFVEKCQIQIAKNNSEIDKYRFDADILLNIVEGKKDFEENRLKEIESLLEGIEKK